MKFKGFTLIEQIITAAIVSIIALGAATAFAAAANILLHTVDESDTDNDDFYEFQQNIQEKVYSDTVIIEGVEVNVVEYGGYTAFIPCE